jgi:DNA-binding transcriptional MerR regulator
VDQYRTIGKVATQLAIPRWWLAYLIERGDVPGPSLQVPGRRLFSDKDFEQIREALAKRLPQQGKGMRRLRKRALARS